MVVSKDRPTRRAQLNTHSVGSGIFTAPHHQEHKKALVYTRTCYLSRHHLQNQICFPLSLPLIIIGF